MAWACWWISGLVLPFVQWHALAPLYSVQLSWMSLGFVAVALSLCQGGSWRPWPAGALLLGSVLLTSAVWTLSYRDRLPWVFVWSAWANHALAWVAILIGGWCAAQTMRPVKILPALLTLLLCLSTLLWWAQSVGLNPLHRIWQSNGGLFNTGTSLAVVSAVSLPILWAWYPQSVVFAWIGLWQGQSAFAWTAAVAWATRRVVSPDMRWLAWPVVTVCAIRADTGNRWLCVLLRLHTWAAYGWHAFQHPFGYLPHPAIPWHPAPLVHIPLLDYPASDWLAVTVAYGWLAGAALLWVAWGLWRDLAPGSWRQAVTIAICLAAVQSAWSNLQSGMMLWLLVIAAYAARRSDGQESQGSCASSLGAA